MGIPSMVGRILAESKKRQETDHENKTGGKGFPSCTLVSFVVAAFSQQSHPNP
jgi:hypothetical protein